MHRGYMKRGFSYLMVFVTSLAVVGFLEFSVLYVIPILIWFYAFFDQINSLSASREEQREIEDKNFVLDILSKERVRTLLKSRHLLGGTFLFLGFGMLLGVMRTAILALLPKFLQVRLIPILQSVPQAIVALLFLYAGICFCQGNKTILEIQERLIKAFDKKKEKKETIANANVVYYMKEGDHVLEQRQERITPANLYETSIAKVSEYVELEKKDEGSI